MITKTITILLLSSAFMQLFGCGQTEEFITEPTLAVSETELTSKTESREPPYILQNIPAITMDLSSEAVNTRGRLNKYYTCEGSNVSPALSWSGTPAGTQSFVILVEDPESDEIEGGTLWTHWILYSIPANATSLPEELTANALPDTGTNGINDYGTTGYSGPCPEPTWMIPVQGCSGSGSGCGNKQTIPAKVRPYNFYIFALDKELDLVPGATRNQVLQEIDGHILGSGKLPAQFRSTIKKMKGALGAPS